MVPAGKFRIERIILRNVTSHAFTSLEPPREGSLALVGPNGAGKSSIVEAVYAALTLNPLRDNSPRVLVRRGAKNAEIRLELVDDYGNKLEARVGLNASGKSVSKDPVLVYNGKVVANRVRDYERRMREILGVPAGASLQEVMANTAIIPQGGLRMVSENLGKPKKLREMLEAALGLPDYKKAVEELSRLEVGEEDYPAVPPRVTSPSPQAISRMKRLADLSKAIERARAELGDNKALVRDLEERASRLEEDLARATSEKERVYARLVMVRERISKLEAREEALRRIRADLVEARRRLEEAEKKLKEAREKASLLPRLERIAAARGLIEELDRLQVRIAEARARVRELEALAAAARTLIEYSREYREYLRLRERLDELVTRRHELEKEKTRLEQEVQSLAKAHEEASRIAVTLARLTGATGDPHEVLEKAYQVLESLEEEAKALEEEAGRLEEEAARHEAKAEEARTALEAIEKATESRCPVCGKPLSIEEQGSLASRLRAKARAEEETAQALRSRARSLRAKAGEARSLINQVSKTAARLEQALRGYDPDKLEEARKRLEDLTGTLDVLKEEESVIRGRLEELEPVYESYVAAQKTLERAGVEDPDKVIREYEEAKKLLEGLEAEKKRLEERILGETGASSIDEARELARRAEKEFEEARRAAAELESLEDAVTAAREKVRALEAEEAKILGELEELPSLRAEEEKLQVRYHEAGEREKTLSGELGRARAALESTREKLRALEDRIAMLERVRKRMLTAVAAGIVLLGAQEALMAEARQELEDAMSDILGGFGLEYSAVEIEEAGDGLQLSLVPRGSTAGSVPVEQLSGGERTALALAYVLALQRMLSMRTGFLLLDEPTSELDAERRATLLDLLREVSEEGSVSQLIIVTHHDEVVDKVDQVCRIIKRDGVSRVECS